MNTLANNHVGRNVVWSAPPGECEPWRCKAGRHGGNPLMLLSSVRSKFKDKSSVLEVVAARRNRSGSAFSNLGSNWNWPHFCSHRTRPSYGKKMEDASSNTSVLHTGGNPGVGIHALSRWEFLKSLNHRLVRDIGFVIASPPLLQKSKELPTASSVMLGGDDKNWPQTARWLQNLDGDLVESWFNSRSRNHRLGDHFALCLEYVLRFLPTSQIHRIMVSEQVLQRSCMAHTQSRRESELEFTLSTAVERKPEGEDHFTNDPLVDAPLATHGLQNGGKRKKKMLRKLEKGSAAYGPGITRTLGEFDFLFKVKDKQLPAGNSHGSHILEAASSQGASCLKEFGSKSVTGEQVIQHWEVTVKFLLYAGPWEPFGLTTPHFASWSKTKLDQQVDSLVEESLRGDHPLSQNQHQLDMEDENEDEMTPEYAEFIATAGDATSVLDSGSSKLCLPTKWLDMSETDKFFGCFLGPHVGESLADRKARLRNQLALSQKPEAYALIRRLFSGEPDTLNPADAKDEEEQDKGIEIVPQALLKGFLFYEYGLWRFLERQRSIQIQTGPTEDTSEAVDSSSSKAMLNMRHWIGWWSRINEFVYLPFSRQSRWYIVPKLEWMTPVVIDGTDAERRTKVLDIQGLREVAAKLADEARARNMPRKRRVLLAEVRWESDLGRWVEVSRGFIVEKTWPNTRLYMPHGFDATWSPTMHEL